MQAPWTKSPKEILDYYAVSPKHGLSKDQVDKHAQLYGRNGMYLDITRPSISQISPVLPEDPATPLWELILEQFKDQLVLILLASAVVSFALALLENSEESTWFGAFVEPLVILLILVANAAVGVIQESSAEKAIDVSATLSTQFLPRQI